MTLRDSVKQGSMTRLGKARVVSVPMASPLRRFDQLADLRRIALAQRQAHLRVALDEGRDHFRAARSAPAGVRGRDVSLPRCAR